MRVVFYEELIDVGFCFGIEGFIISVGGFLMF